MVFITSVRLDGMAWRLEGDVEGLIDVTFCMAVPQDRQLEFGCNVAVMIICVACCVNRDIKMG